MVIYGKKFESLTFTFPAGGEQGDVPSPFSSHVLPAIYLVPDFSHFCAFFFLVILLINMAPKHGAEMLSSVSKCKRL